MLPPAPPTFSRMTGWPRIGRILSARIRAAVSVEPPGGNGTISVICRDGNVCALRADRARDQDAGDCNDDCPHVSLPRFGSVRRRFTAP